MSSKSRILFTKGAGHRTEADVMQHAMYQYTLLKSTEARLHAVHPVTKDFIRDVLSFVERLDLFAHIIKLEATDDVESDVLVALQITKANILAVNGEAKSTATSGVSMLAQSSNNTADINEHASLWSMEVHGGVLPPAVASQLSNYDAPACHTDFEDDNEVCRSDGVITPTMMSPRLTQPFNWTHDNEEYSVAAETDQLPNSEDTIPYELEGSQNIMAFEIEATPATSSLPVPTAASLRNHAHPYGSKDSLVRNAEAQGSRSRTLQPGGLPPVSEESAVDTEVEAVPRRTSRSYAVSGTSLVGSGAEELRQHREARQREEKRRREQADQVIAEDLQQEDHIRSENERWQQEERRRMENERRQQEERRHMEMHALHQKQEQDRAEAALAEQLGDDEEDLSDHEYIWVKVPNGGLHLEDRRIRVPRGSYGYPSPHFYR